MIEIKGRKFEGELEQMIDSDENFRKDLEEIYDIKRDIDGEAIGVRWD